MSKHNPLPSVPPPPPPPRCRWRAECLAGAWGHSQIPVRVGGPVTKGELGRLAGLEERVLDLEVMSSSSKLSVEIT